MLAPFRCGPFLLSGEPVSGLLSSSYALLRTCNSYKVSHECIYAYWIEDDIAIHTTLLVVVIAHLLSVAPKRFSNRQTVTHQSSTTVCAREFVCNTYLSCGLCIT